jgi:hypothetical protein
MYRTLTGKVPLKAVAQELGLSIHERDTFTGWEVGIFMNYLK